MTKNKNASLLAKTENSKSFSQVLFTIYSFLFLFIGIILLTFTKKVSLLSIIGNQVNATIVVEQFLGSFLILLSFFMFIVRKLEGQVILNCILALIFVGFINLYLLIVLADNIILSSIYFIFQIAMQLSFFIVLFEQLKRKK